MFRMHKIVLTLAVLLCLTLPCAAQGRKKNPAPAKKDPPPTSPMTPPVRNPEYHPYFPTVPTIPSTPKNRITKPSHEENVADFLRRQAINDALRSSTLRTYNPLTPPPVYAYPLTSPYSSPYSPYPGTFNPYQNTPIGNPYQNPWSSPYQNMMLNPYQSFLNPYQNAPINPLVQNPYQMPAVNPYNPWAQPLNPLNQANNPFRYNPALLPGVGIFGGIF